MLTVFHLLEEFMIIFIHHFMNAGERFHDSHFSGSTLNFVYHRHKSRTGNAYFWLMHHIEERVQKIPGPCVWVDTLDIYSKRFFGILKIYVVARSTAWPRVPRASTSCMFVDDKLAVREFLGLIFSNSLDNYCPGWPRTLRAPYRFWHLTTP